MTSLRIALLALICLVVMGCQSQKPQPKNNLRTTVRTNTQAGNKPVNMQDFDDCAGRIHDIGGLFLLYFASHNQMPQTLDEALTVAGPLERPELTCPVSKQPYVYSAQGFTTRGDPRVLVLYDPAPVHNGNYRALLMNPPTPGQPLQTWVVQLPPLALQTYLASRPQQ